VLFFAGTWGIAETGGRFLPACTVRGRSFVTAVDEEEVGSVFTFKLSFALDMPSFYKFFTTSAP
jgi:hypothetical protein